MSVNDRLYDELLKPLVEDYYSALKVLATLPAGDTRVTRAWQLGRLDAFETTGDRIADVLNVARPDWAATRDLAAAR